MTRYLSGLANLILTDYLEFRWYVNGSIAAPRSWRRSEWVAVAPGPDGAQRLSDMLQAFLRNVRHRLATRKELAGGMAVLAKDAARRAAQPSA